MIPIKRQGINQYRLGYVRLAWIYLLKRNHINDTVGKPFRQNEVEMSTKIFCLQFTNSISCKFVLIQTWTKIWIFFRRAAACIQTCFDSESVFRHPSVEGDNGEA